MQGVQGIEHLPAPAHKKHMEGVRGIEHLRAPALKEPMQGVRGIEHLPAPAQEEPMQGARSKYPESARTSAEQVDARNAEMQHRKAEKYF